MLEHQRESKSSMGDLTHLLMKVLEKLEGQEKKMVELEKKMEAMKKW